MRSIFSFRAIDRPGFSRLGVFLFQRWIIHPSCKSVQVRWGLCRLFLVRQLRRKMGQFQAYRSSSSSLVAQPRKMEVKEYNMAVPDREKQLAEAEEILGDRLKQVG